MPKISRRASLMAGATFLAATSAGRTNLTAAETTHIPADPILNWLRVSTLAVNRLLDLDLAGRSQITFMRGHMSEIARYTRVKEYFGDFYTKAGKEFLQFDDYSFVLHHCLRVLYGPWKEEVDLLHGSALWPALKNIGGGLPELRDPPTSPNRGPGAVKANWYSDVYKALSEGSMPVEQGVRNEVLPQSECILSGPEGLDLIWASFLVYGCDVWARQIPPMWELVGSAIAARRTVERMSKGEIEKAVADRPEAYRTYSLEFTRLVETWQAYHAETVDIHDPMLEKSVRGLVSWITSLTDDIASWTIKPIAKDEMYAEVASTILTLRGKPTSVMLQEPRYWRTVHFAPPSNKDKALGMPPFDESHFGFQRS